MNERYEHGLDALGAEREPIPVCYVMPLWEQLAIAIGGVAGLTTIWMAFKGKRGR